MSSGPQGGHEDTAAAWDVVARAKYEGELDEHVTLLKPGGHDLLPEEASLPWVLDLDSWAEAVRHLRAPGGRVFVG
ncbi:MAG TPA: hypothetical protein VE173_13235 [Longimicrobiales bacterium]|nr:hypothetical protein [Longimicrobiales bacterium]